MNLKKKIKSLVICKILFTYYFFYGKISLSKNGRKERILNMYATKEECRRCLLVYKKYIKLSVFAKEYKLPVTNLSMFLKGDEYDYYFSLSRLNGFIIYIQEFLTHNIL